MTTVDDDNTEIRRVDGGMMWTFSRDQRVDSLSRGETQGGRIGSRTGQDCPSASAMPVDKRSGTRRSAELSRERDSLREQIGGEEIRSAGYTDLRSLIFPEPVRPRQPKRTGEKGTVADFLIGIEGEVRRIRGDVVVKEHPESFVCRSNKPLQPTPEHPVMQYEHVGIRGDRTGYRSRREVDGGYDATQRAAMVELKTIQRGRVVGIAGRREKIIEEGSHFGSAGHA